MGTSEGRIPRSKRKGLRKTLSHSNLARLEQSLLTPNFSVGSNLSQISSQANNNDPDNGIISRGELEKELNQIREQIMNLQLKWKQQELEKMSYFQLIKAFLLFFNIYLSLLTSYQTFATKYNELEIGIAEPNTIQLIAILFRALPYIFTKKTCFRA